MTATQTASFSIGLVPPFRQWRNAGQQMAVSRSAADGSPLSQVFNEGVGPEGTPQRLCPHSAVLKERRLSDDEVERDVGEHDAVGWHRSR